MHLQDIMICKLHCILGIIFQNVNEHRINSTPASTFQNTYIKLHLISVRIADQKGYKVKRFYSGFYMTSLEMHGFSVSIMLLTDQTIKLLGKHTCLALQ